jgi:prepilin-type N-terminal cleavage/methylation domain-containing protein
VKRNSRKSGFSLTEMLIAMGIMAIGLVMVATVFPVGVKLTSLASERAIGAVVADEAFAKIQLYGVRDFQYWSAARVVNPANPNPYAAAIACSQYRYATGYAGPDGVFWTADDNRMSPGPDGNWGTADDINWDSEFLYPSTALQFPEKPRYHWSALCRRTGLKEVQVTVFVNRKTADSAVYRSWTFNGTAFAAKEDGIWPTPVRIGVLYNSAPAKRRELQVDLDNTDNKEWAAIAPADANRVLRFFSEGVTVMDDYTGKVYRVMEYLDTDGNGMRDTLVLDQDWQPNVAAGQAEYIWVVPPAVGSNRYPCVGVFQKVLYVEDIQ